MLQIGLITNYNITEKAMAAFSVCDELFKYGAQPMYPAYYKTRLVRMHDPRLENMRAVPIDELYESADILITLGGDGTILETARRAALRKTPILAFNLGRLGYMAELELNELDKLRALFDGSYRTEIRTMLQAETVNLKGEVLAQSFALNEATVTNGSAARIIDLELSDRGTPVTSYHGDGLIISTPTGSTAYSLSAGGPVIDPSLECLCTTPICPHSLNLRPILFPDSAVLEVKNLSKRERKLIVTLDGKINLPLEYQHVLRVTKSSLTTSLIRMSESGFYNRLRLKMSSMS
ncbi:MAG: NAD(+)/NADH kinase [Clostridia bacterium]|nr:NAD(+)/NADH kinase [Clostridia bacterium]